MKTTYETEKVGTTKDYSMFKFFERNRIVNKNWVEVLRKDMLHKGQLQRVIVNEKGYVTDGQHRIKALMKDNKPVKFRIEKGATMENVISTNNTNKSWNGPAWLRSYVHVDHVNHKPYEQYKKFKKEHGLGESVCKLLLTEDFHNNGIKAFKEGTFEVKNFERASDNAVDISELVAISDKLTGIRAVSAILKLKDLKDFKMNLFKCQLKRNHSRIVKPSNKSDWIDMLIEKVYNHGLRPPHKRLKNRIIV